MKPNDKLIELINYRINFEEYSSRLYYAMSVWLDNEGYNSSSLWKKYAEEELVHAKKAYDFLLSFSIMPDIRTIQSVDTEFKDLPSIIKRSYEHELIITKQCEELALAGQTTGNFMVFDLGMWYVHEQIEEIEKVDHLCNLLKTFYDGSKVSLQLLDKEISI